MDNCLNRFGRHAWSWNGAHSLTCSEIGIWKWIWKLTRLSKLCETHIHPWKCSPLKNIDPWKIFILKNVALKYIYTWKNIHPWKIFILENIHPRKCSPLNHPWKIFTPEKYSLLKNIHPKQYSPLKIFTPEKCHQMISFQKIYGLFGLEHHHTVEINGKSL